MKYNIFNGIWKLWKLRKCGTISSRPYHYDVFILTLFSYSAEFGSPPHWMNFMPRFHTWLFLVINKSIVVSDSTLPTFFVLIFILCICFLCFVYFRMFRVTDNNRVFDVTIYKCHDEWWNLESSGLPHQRLNLQRFYTLLSKIYDSTYSAFGKTDLELICLRWSLNWCQKSWYVYEFSGVFPFVVNIVPE